ncbi:hypothetical protein GCM10027289_25920 [Tsukamurella serpentis]
MVAEPGESIAGYVIESVLGTGGMGTVYRVRHRTLPRSVALKVLQSQMSSDPSVRARFDREADMIAALKHPHIVDVYDRGETDGHLWIAMELVEGGNLAETVRREGPFTLDRTVAAVEQVADALDYAHQRGILHRDVKPANFLVDPGRRGEQVKLADFGIGAAQTEVGQHTQTGTVVGTLAYTAPEALLGDPVDHRADVYSLACATVVLLSGAPPFTSTVSGQLILAHISQNPPSIRLKRPDLSPEVDFVLARGLAKNPADRYATAGEFADALAAASRRAPGASGPATLPPLPPQGPYPVPMRSNPSNPATVPGGPFQPDGRFQPGAQVQPGTRFQSGAQSPQAAIAAVPRRRRTAALIGGAVALVLVLATVLGVVLLGGDDSGDAPALDAWSPRTITDANGETRIDDRPSRIVALGPGDAEIVSALGFDVVAGANGPKSELPSWVPALKNVTSAGTAVRPDRSAVEAAKPDLIIDTDPAAAQAVKDLKSVAGGRAITAPGSAKTGWTWQDQLSYIAQALGAKDRATAVREKYESRITALRSANPAFSGKKIDVVHFDGTSTSVAGDSAGAFQLLGQLGFSMQAPGSTPGSAWSIVGSSDLYKVVNSREVDKVLVARTDPAAGNGGYDGLPSSLTYGAPVIIVDRNSGVDALLYGGPLAIDTVESQVLPALVKGIK